MCFSATASFTVAAGLIPLGGYCVRTVLRSARLERLPMAMIPICFGIQQILEGLVWIGITHQSPEPFTRLSSLAYLFFAFAFWLVWIPIACLRWSGGRLSGRHRTLLRLNLLMGSISGALLWIPLLGDPSLVRPENQLGSINYNTDLLLDGVISQPVGRLIYIGIIILPLLMIRDPRVHIFAATLLAATMISVVAYDHAFASVWCYFSAIASALILWIISVPESPQDSEIPGHVVTSL
jgi:hypothetical protein